MSSKRHVNLTTLPNPRADEDRKLSLEDIRKLKDLHELALPGGGLEVIMDEDERGGRIRWVHYESFEEAEVRVSPATATSRTTVTVRVPDHVTVIVEKVTQR